MRTTFYFFRHEVAREDLIEDPDPGLLLKRLPATSAGE